LIEEMKYNAMQWNGSHTVYIASVSIYQHIIGYIIRRMHADRQNTTTATQKLARPRLPSK